MTTTYSIEIKPDDGLNEAPPVRHVEAWELADVLDEEITSDSSQREYVEFQSVTITREES